MVFRDLRSGSLSSRRTTSTSTTSGTTTTRLAVTRPTATGGTITVNKEGTVTERDAQGNLVSRTTISRTQAGSIVRGEATTIEAEVAAAKARPPEVKVAEAPAPPPKAPPTPFQRELQAQVTPVSKPTLFPSVFRPPEPRQIVEPKQLAAGLRIREAQVREAPQTLAERLFPAVRRGRIAFEAERREERAREQIELRKVTVGVGEFAAGVEQRRLERLAAQRQARLDVLGADIQTQISAGAITLEAGQKQLEKALGVARERQIGEVEISKQLIRKRIKGFEPIITTEATLAAERLQRKRLEATITGVGRFGLEEFVARKIPGLPKAVKGLKVKALAGFERAETGAFLTRLSKTSAVLQEAGIKVGRLTKAVTPQLAKIERPFFTLRAGGAAISAGAIRRPITTAAIGTAALATAGISQVVAPALASAAAGGSKAATVAIGAGKVGAVGLGAAFVGVSGFRIATAPTPFEVGARIGETAAFTVAGLAGAVTGTKIARQLQISKAVKGIDVAKIIQRRGVRARIVETGRIEQAVKFEGKVFRVTARAKTLVLPKGKRIVSLAAIRIKPATPGLKPTGKEAQFLFGAKGRIRGRKIISKFEIAKVKDLFLKKVEAGELTFVSRRISKFKTKIVGVERVTEPRGRLPIGAKFLAELKIKTPEFKAFKVVGLKKAIPRKFILPKKMRIGRIVLGKKAELFLLEPPKLITKPTVITKPIIKPTVDVAPIVGTRAATRIFLKGLPITPRLALLPPALALIPKTRLATLITAPTITAPQIVSPLLAHIPRTITGVIPAPALAPPVTKTKLITQVITPTIPALPTLAVTAPFVVAPIPFLLPGGAGARRRLRKRRKLRRPTRFQPSIVGVVRKAKKKRRKFLTGLEIRGIPKVKEKIRF